MKSLTRASKRDLCLPTVSARAITTIVIVIKIIELLKILFLYREKFDPDLQKRNVPNRERWAH